MDQELDSIMNGARFSTALSVARVVNRLHHGGVKDEVLLLEVAPSSHVPAYQAWTTVPALMLALETGGWSLCPPGAEVPNPRPAFIR